MKKELIIGIIYIALIGIGANMVHSVTPLLIQTLGIADFWFGVFFACMSLASLLFSPIWGSISDTKSRKLPLVLGLFIYATGQIGFSFFKNPVLICVCRFISGVGTAGMFGTIYTYISDYLEDQNRTSMLSVIAAIQSVATACGYLIGGFIGDKNYLLTFYLQVAFMCSIGIFAVIFLKDQRLNQDKVSNEGTKLFDINVYKTMIVGVSGVIFILLLIESYSYNSYNSAISYFICTILLINPSGIGFYMAAIGLFGLFINMIVTPRLRKTMNDYGLAIVSSLFAAVFLLIAIMTTSHVMISLSMMILYASTRIIFKPVFTSIVLKKEKNKGKALGLMASMESLGGVLGSLSAGFAFNMNPLLPFVLATGLLFLLFSGLIKARNRMEII